jgi:hypothetical protein
MRIVALALALLLAGCAREAGTGFADCGTAPSDPKSSQTASWGPDAPLFLLHRDGRLERGNFRGGDWTLIGDHRFDHGFGQVSPDEHWLVLHGLTKRDSQVEIWAYDTASGSEQLLLRRPAGGEALPHISPDGRTVAIYANFNPEEPDEENSGLFLFDLASGKREHVPFPKDFRLDPREARATMRWSAASDSLYLFMSGGREPEAGRAIYRVHPADGRFEWIEGVYNGKPWSSDLRVAGQPVPLEPHMLLPSRQDFDELESSDRSYRAKIDPVSLELSVTGSAGGERHVGTGRATECVPNSIEIKAWLGHFLVYELDGTPFLYDAEGGRSRRIGEPGDEYFWFSRRLERRSAGGTGF